MAPRSPAVVAALLVALCSSLSATPALPQVQVTGTVRDATGAVVPGVAITATNRATRATRTATTEVDFELVAQLAEEITVTAMKRESTVLDVPFSVAAPTEQTVRDRGADDIESVAANVGGFTVQNLAGRISGPCRFC